MAAGRVTYTGYNSQRGNYIKIQNTDGTTSLYQHLSSFAARVGDNVQAGQKIALSGNTGVGTGPHLHFELWKNGSPIDPLAVSYGAGSVNIGDQITETIKNNWLIIAGALVIIAILAK